MCERIAGRELDWSLSDDARIGDHRWWVSDLSELQRDYPGFEITLRHRGRAARDPRRQRRALGGGALMKLSVVIPAHNEAGSVGQTVEAVAAELRAESIPYEIVVVDDHSTDGTADAVAAIAERDEDVRLIENVGPGGFGYAVRAGLDAFTGDAVAIVMADLSDSPRDLVTYYHLLAAGLRLRLRVALHARRGRVGLPAPEAADQPGW